MGKWGSWCAIALASAMAVGCGDDDDAANSDAAAAVDSQASIDAVPPDASLPDANTCPDLAFGAYGGPCNNDVDCGTDGFCVDEMDMWPATGYCTKGCTTNGECATGSSCVRLTPFGQGGGAGGGDAGVVDAGPPADGGNGPPTALCLPNCCAGDMCPTGQLCGDRLTGFFALSEKSCSPGDSTAIDGQTCTGSHECNVNSFCLQGLNNPGGYCSTLGCVVGGPNTCAPGGDAICAGSGVGEIGLCIDSCTQQSDCRTSEGYKCVTLGQLQVCVHPNVGDPCTQNSDCGASPWECLTQAGDGYPNGYCTVKGCDPTAQESCTDESFCHDPNGTPNSGDEFCVRECETSMQCRGGVGYVCEVGTGGEPMGCFVD